MLSTKLDDRWEPATVALHIKCSLWKTVFTDEDDWSCHSYYLILSDPRVHIELKL